MALRPGAVRSGVPEEEEVDPFCLKLSPSCVCANQHCAPRWQYPAANHLHCLMGVLAACVSLAIDPRPAGCSAARRAASVCASAVSAADKLADAAELSSPDLMCEKAQAAPRKQPLGEAKKYRQGGRVLAKLEGAVASAAIGRSSIVLPRRKRWKPFRPDQGEKEEEEATRYFTRFGPPSLRSLSERDWTRRDSGKGYPCPQHMVQIRFRSHNVAYMRCAGVRVYRVKREGGRKAKRKPARLASPMLNSHQKLASTT